MPIENRESKLEESTKALFLDRDGTLIIDKEYLADPAGVELIPGVAAALRRAQKLGYLLFLFTNQSGIGRGYHSLDDALRVNTRMEVMLGLPLPIFTEICIAPEAPDQPSLYRKPSPRFIQEMLAKHALDPAQCWMLGDRDSDIAAGLAAGLRSVALCTGKYNAAGWAARVPPGVPVYPDFPAFVATLT